MVVYLPSSDNSLAAARQIADKTGDTLMHQNESVDATLPQETIVGLVYHAYLWDAPLIVKRLVPNQNISPIILKYKK